MCAIVGMVGEPAEGQWQQTHAVLEALFLAAEARGRDATGFAALTAPYKLRSSRGVVADKQPLPASQFVRANGAWRHLRHQRCVAVVAHVRQATHGSPAVNTNNHPHSGSGFHLVHNGIIRNHQEVARRFGLRLRSQCDSEVILRFIEAAQQPADGLGTALACLGGTMAVAVLDEHVGAVWIARNEGRSLWLLKIRDDSRWFFASTEEVLVGGLERIVPRLKDRIELLFPIPADVVCCLTPSGCLLAHQIVMGQRSLFGV